MNEKISEMTDLNLRYQIKVNELCLPLQHLKISYFSFFSIYPLEDAKKLLIICPNTSFLRQYFYRKYYLYDPHIVDPNKLEEGAALWSAYSNSNYQGKYLYKLKENFGIDNGLSLIRKNQTKCYIFCFGVSKTNTRFFYNIFRNVVLLKCFTDYFLNEGNKIIEGFSKSSIDICDLKGKGFFLQKGISQGFKVKNPIKLI